MTERELKLYPRTGKLRNIILLGRESYTKEGFRMFKDTPRKSLGGVTPRQAIAQGKTGLVLGLVASIAEGTNSI